MASRLDFFSSILVVLAPCLLLLHYAGALNPNLHQRQVMRYGDHSAKMRNGSTEKKDSNAVSSLQTGDSRNFLSNTRVNALAPLSSGTLSHRMLRGRELGEPPANDPFLYWGGYLITGNPNINLYVTYYGSWNDPKEMNILNNFMSSIDGPRRKDNMPTVVKWWKIEMKYFMKMKGQQKRTYVGPHVNLRKVVVDRYSRGRGPFFQEDMAAIANAHIKAGHFPVDRSGIYIEMTSADVKVDGFCSSFCGVHDVFNSSGGTELYYAFVGHFAQCMDKCKSYDVMPNGYPAAEAMVNILGHEIIETVTDPSNSPLGWTTNNGVDDLQENGDLCEYDGWGRTMRGRDRRGRTYFYNMVGNWGMRFLVQPNYDWTTKKCEIQGRRR